MELYEHVFLSSLVAPLVAAATVGTSSPYLFILSFLLAVAAGTLMDADHFLVMRWEAGDWRDIKKLVKEPLSVALDFRELTVFSPRKKYVTHVLTGGIFIAATLIMIPRFYPLVAAMVAFHFGCDLYASLQKQEWPFGGADPRTERNRIL